MLYALICFLKFAHQNVSKRSLHHFIKQVNTSDKTSAQTTQLAVPIEKKNPLTGDCTVLIENAELCLLCSETPSACSNVNMLFEITEVLVRCYMR